MLIDHVGRVHLGGVAVGKFVVALCAHPPKLLHRIGFLHVLGHEGCQRRRAHSVRLGLLAFAVTVLVFAAALAWAGAVAPWSGRR
jgi:hypothetical protein